MTNPEEHPDELLAALVDGELTDAERAQAEAHLATCETCREEVDLARRARTAVASLEDVPVPLGVTGPVLQAARKERPRLVRLARPVAWAAAAAVVGVGAWVGLRAASDGGDEEGELPSAAEAPAEAQATLEAALPFEIQDVNYTDTSLQELAGRLAAESGAPAEEAFGGEAEEEAQDRAATEASPVAPLPTPREEVRVEAFECLQQGAELGPDAQVVKIIAASFKGTPAYIGAFLEGPGAGEPPDRLVIWVVSRDDCALLSFVRQLL